MVQRGELPRQVERLRIGRRSGGDQADPLRHGGQGREQGERLQATLDGVLRLIEQGEDIGEEQAVQQPGLGGAGDLAVVVDIRQSLTGGRGVPPGGLMVSTGVDEDVQVKVSHRCIPLGLLPVELACQLTRIILPCKLDGKKKLGRKRWPKVNATAGAASVHW